MGGSNILKSITSHTVGQTFFLWDYTFICCVLVKMVRLLISIFEFSGHILIGTGHQTIYYTYRNNLFSWSFNFN